jgi:hypothetical protein
MQAHLKEISRQVAPGAHGVILLDRAGWHTSGELKPPQEPLADLLALTGTLTEACARLGVDVVR